MSDSSTVNKTEIDLTDSSKYDVSTYYPVYGTTIGMSRNFRLTCTAVLYASGTPSWSTHSGGFFATVDVLDCGVSWGARTYNTIILDNDYNFVNGAHPIKYMQLTNSSTPVFYVRGGGKYIFNTDYGCIWTVVTNAITIREQILAPETSILTTDETNTHAIVLEHLRVKVDRNGDTLTGTLNVPDITFRNQLPFVFQGNGSGTYTCGVFYCNSEGMAFETPRETDNGGATVLPFKILTRGGQYAPLYAGNMYSNNSKVLTSANFSLSGTTLTITT